jgi:glycine oxidase
VGTAAGPSVVILGGGVIGLSIALELSSTAIDCTVVDPRPGRGASWAAAGMLSRAAEVAPGELVMLADLAEAAELWPAFAQRIERDGVGELGYVASGSILVGLTASDAREAARFVALATSSGVSVEPLSTVDLTDLGPGLVEGVGAAWSLSGDHSVDNRRLVDGLLASVKAQGVTILEDRCIRVNRESSGVRCTLEHQGDLVADRVVLATGAAPPAPGLEELDLPHIRPVRGATLRLTARRGVELLQQPVRAIVQGFHCYLVPRSNGELVVGATSEEQGFEEIARAGGVFQLLDAARSIYPGIDEMALEQVAVGLRPATEDHVPFVRALRDPRIVAALGHYRNGILLAPLTAQRAVEVLGIRR